MADSIHSAVWDWLLTCPLIHDLFFNFSAAHNGDTVLVPLTAGAETIIREFTSGASERRYSFALVRFDAISDAPNDSSNVDQLIDVEGLARWVADQAQAHNYPQFPDGCTVFDVCVYDAQTVFAAQSDTQGKYMLQFYIDYLKEAAK